MFEPTRYEFTLEIEGYEPWIYVVTKTIKGWVLQRWDGKKNPTRLWLKTDNGWTYGAAGVFHPQIFNNQYEALDVAENDIEDKKNNAELAQMA